MAPPPSKPPDILWRPSTNKTKMDVYRHHVNDKFNLQLSDSQALHSWTVIDPQSFWVDLYSYLRLHPPLPSHITVAYDRTLPMSAVPRWFEGLEMNYAENVLLNALGNGRGDIVALIGLREGDGRLNDEDVEKVSWKELNSRVHLVKNAMRYQGVRKGDVVAALVSTGVEVVVLFLASACLGAVFSSVSPDLGVEGCISRFRQVRPRILFADDYATFKGKKTSTISKVNAILEKLDEKPKTFIIDTAGARSESHGQRARPQTDLQKSLQSYTDFLISTPDSQRDDENYLRVPFSHPLFICYTSGTTGTPKCIAHQHGVLLNMRKISMLHNSIGPGETVLQYSSTSWVMFQIMMGHLASGASIILYDGSPMWPDVRQFLRIAEKYRVTYIGTSPRYLYELEKARVIPKTEYDLSSLRMVNTTGATLSENQYHWFYNHMPSRVHLSNSAGGTDTASSLIAADPTAPVHIGEMQMCGLGMDIDILDSETGQSIKSTGEQGEMVIRQPFPSMPTCFWGDDNIDKNGVGEIYRAAYFERYNGSGIDVWAQHDWLSYNSLTKGWIMHGRSDGVLNPSGIRFGSGEVYAIVESSAFTSEIADSLCVGRRRQDRNDHDETVFLFVVMAKQKLFNVELEKRLRTAIATALSPRHVPKFIIAVDEIPVTINGKKVETAVKQIISGKNVKASSTVANPGCLPKFKRFVDFEGVKRESKL